MRKNSTGFTLVELAVVLMILGLLAGLTAPNIMEEMNARRAALTVQETQTIVDAARMFRAQNGSWPGGGTCASALSTLTTSTPPFLVGIGAVNKYGSVISTSCTASTFSVDQTAIEDWDGWIANSLPGTVVVDTTAHLLRSTVGIPGSEPALDGKLSRIATGNAELNRMRATLLLGGNDIQEVNNISTNSINASGHVQAGTLTAAGQIQAGSVATSGTIYAAGAITSSGAMTAAGSMTTYGNMVASGQVVSGSTLTAQGQSQFAGQATFYDQLALQKVVGENTGCSVIGALARDGAGKTLSCQGYVWKSNGGGDPGVGTGFMTGIAGSYKNRITGGYSCPAGLVANLIGGVQIGGCQPCLSYSCSMP
ncbi:prepilin-type N-terminal cleavage/methylation domain-containing protein [Pseudomonas sp. P9(2020)]|uniref:prepilin-type N-terminal cleavage/methylation domain-containing protein n=1 Tax=Pseudomonas sp. P9(2020) TaxID=2763316 RepID=UPI001B3337C6|nr:prepilin-type N-terminal cleavage/methylation domain-containing protein [Pseudomonas sp. P9(2020)]MBP5948073.1 prepilin-type N-terminal cleavage/methylation domain-containing protein [Pseudomonas sp. P9(2020)]